MKNNDMEVQLIARVAVAVVCMCSWTWAFADIDDIEQRLTAPLVQAGIALDDEAGLVRALQRNDNPRLATSAAYVLGKLPRTDMAVRELTVAASSEDEILMNFAIRSLLRLRDGQWVNAASARLRNVGDSVQRLELAGELAQGGVFDGWDLIASAIAEGDPGHREVALRQVGCFQQMKDASGKSVNLIEKLDRLRIGAPQPVRDAVLAKIVELTTEKGPPAKGRAPRK